MLHRIDGGDASAANELMPLVYDHLRSVAASYLKQERPDHTLQPTALVNEAYLRLVDQESVEWDDPGHFLSVTARIMRQTLVDCARERSAAKRGGDWLRVTFDEALTFSSERSDDVLAIEEALSELKEMDERKARVVELRFFGGLTIEETAKVLEISPKTVEADWYAARAWLRTNLCEYASPKEN